MSSWGSFFLGGRGELYDSSYPGEFLCFPEVTGIATKFRFCKNQVIEKKQVIAKKQVITKATLVPYSFH